MVRHIVMWKFDAKYTIEEKAKLCNDIQVQLMALNNKIEEIKSLNVSQNSKQAPENNHDILLDTTFASFVDLEKYQVHPEHIKVGKFLKSLKLQRAAIDFEV